MILSRKILAGILITLIILLGGCNSSYYSESFILDSLQYEPGFTLEIANNRGDIIVGNNNSETVEIIIRARAGAEEEKQAKRVVESLDFKREYDNSSGVLKISDHLRDSFDFDYRLYLDYKILIPEEFSARFVTGYGDIEVENIRGDLYADSDYGQLEINKMKGNLRARVNNGIRINQLKSAGDLYLKSGYGDIDIDYLELADNTSNYLETSGGKIKINISGTVEVLTSTGGDVLYEGSVLEDRNWFVTGRRPTEDSPRLELDSIYGEIEVERW